MGLFSKNTKATEKNEINNKSLKEKLANTALMQLELGKDYEQLAYTTVKFGYLFMIDGHGVEALFKITTDKGDFYFAAQGEKLLFLEFNEEMFEATTKHFFELHK